MKYYDVIIVGAGPCGLMSAHTIKNKKILLIDANNSLGGKIKVSGGGRCNITNNKEVDLFLNNIPKNNKFLYSTFNNFAPKELINFFEDQGIKLKEEDNNRIFPKSNKSQEFINFFTENLNKNNKEVKLNYLVKDIVKSNNEYIIDEKFKCKFLVLCLGGASYSHISQGFQSYDLLSSLNHTTTELLPCESPLVITDPLIEAKTLQGVTLQHCKGELYINNKKKITITKDILFTHFGLSGPLALNLSYYAKEALNKHKLVSLKLIPENPPKKVIPFLIDNNHLTFNISDIKGFKTAFVTNGGINLKEINPQSLESKLNTNLYIGGELLDINCFTGGYNIGTYLSMGKLIGDKINEK